MGGSKSSNTSTNQTTNVDNRITSQSGDIFGLSVEKDAINNNSGQIIVNDTAAVELALNTVKGLSTQVLDTAKSLADGSNTIADNVRASQEQFVETASGQKVAGKLVLALGVVGGGYLLLKLKAKK